MKIALAQMKMSPSMEKNFEKTKSLITEALHGAELIIIPTANTSAEPSELFQWEVRIQAFQNSTNIAMCNRVGTEDEMEFNGESLVADYNGNANQQWLEEKIAALHDADDKTVEKFCAALKVITFAVSLGHDESLIFPQPSYDERIHLYPEKFRKGFIRFSVGLEETEDINADLELSEAVCRVQLL